MLQSHSVCSRISSLEGPLPVTLPLEAMGSPSVGGGFADARRGSGALILSGPYRVALSSAATVAAAVPMIAAV